MEKQDWLKPYLNTQRVFCILNYFGRIILNTPSTLLKDKLRARVLGNETRVKVLKNKVAPPFKQAEFQILYNQGISRESEIIELGVAQDLIEKAGAWYSVDGERIGQGKDNARDYLKENTQLRESLESKIREKLMQGATDTVE